MTASLGSLCRIITIVINIITTKQLLQPDLSGRYRAFCEIHLPCWANRCSQPGTRLRGGAEGGGDLKKRKPLREQNLTAHLSLGWINSSSQMALKTVSARHQSCLGLGPSNSSPGPCSASLLMSSFQPRHSKTPPPGVSGTSLKCRYDDNTSLANAIQFPHPIAFQFRIKFRLCHGQLGP